MSDPKGKALPDLLSMYFIMLLIYCADVFLLKSDLTVLGDNFYSRFLCMTVLLLTVLFKKESLQTFGIDTKKKKFAKSVFYGVIFSVVPTAIVLLVEYVIIYRFYPSELDFSFSPPSLNFVETEGYLTPTACIVIYLLATVFAVCFKEFFFRGFLLSRLQKLTSFNSANVFQAALYAMFYLPKLLRDFLTDGYVGNVRKFAVFVIAFYIIHEFISGLKWGMASKKSGVVYISIIDNFLYSFLVGGLCVSSTNNLWLFMSQALAIQLISFFAVLVYTRLAPDDMPEKAVKKANPKVQLNSVYSSEIVGSVDLISPDGFKSVTKSESMKNSTPKMSETEIDDFLKDFNRPKSSSSSQRSETEKPEEDDSFDVDKFLQSFSTEN